MADYLPQATGNWTTTTWITAFGGLSAFAGGNTPPTVIDDVYADGKTITVNIDTAVRSIRTTTTPRTGGLAGGGFIMNDGISLSANILAGTTNCLTFLSAAPATATLVGSVTGSSTTASVRGFNNNSTGTFTIRGNVVGGAPSTSVSNVFGAINSSSGTINVFGDVYGGFGTQSDVFAIGINNSSSGTVNVNGTVYGGPGNHYGIRNVLSTSVTNVTGNVFANLGSGGGNALNGTGIFFVLGNVRGGSGSSYGMFVNGNVTVIGNLSGWTGTNSWALQLESPGVASISGTIIGGAGTSTPGILNNGTTSTISITGTVFGGTTGSGSYGVQNSSTGTVTLFGSAFGSNTRGDAWALYNSGAGTITVFGNVVGGTPSDSDGARNNNIGTIMIYGDAIAGAGATAHGIRNISTGMIYVTRAVGNQFGLGSVGLAGTAAGVANSQNGRAYVEQVEFGSRGATPISGPVYILPSNRNTLVGYTTALGTPVTFYNSLSVNGLLPPVSSVQAGVVYNVGNSVGTMAVPSASAVQFGIAVDNTIGTAALQPQDVWGYARLSATQVNSMGDRLRNTATTQSIGYQIASFNL